MEKETSQLAKMGRKLVRERLDIFLPFALIALFIPWVETEGYEQVIMPVGAAFSLFGLYLRGWSMRYCGKAGAQEDGVKKLTCTGPYRIFRNPLYVANILIMSGLIVLSEVLWVLPAFIVYAGVRYNSIVKREEMALIVQFGDDYKEYCGRVRRWFPSKLLPLDQPRRGWGVVLKNESVEIACCAVGAAVLILKDVWLKSWIFGM